MKPKTIEVICDEVAKENGARDWNHVEHLNDDFRLWPEVCKRYAIEVAKASLKKASENAITEVHPKDVLKRIELQRIVIDKSSITNEQNIVL